MKDKYKNKEIVGIIPARMQSSRFYGKPLAKILGKEMIQWVYEICAGCRILKEVYVATDHEDIANFCQAKGMRFMMTSPEHLTCSDRSSEVCSQVGADFIVEVQGDEPTLLSSEIDNLIECAFSFDQFDVVIPYTEITAEEALDPNNVKVVIGPHQQALFFSRSPIPYDFKNKLPQYYKQVGLYIWSSASIRRFSQIPRGYLEKIEDSHMLRLIEHGFDARMVHSSIKTVGVDVPQQIAQAEEFLRKRQEQTAFDLNEQEKA